MPTARTRTDQILIALNADSTVRGLAAYDVTEVLGDDGRAISGVPMPPRDIKEGEAGTILAPVIPAQQAQIADLQAQLGAAQRELDALKASMASTDEQASA